MDLRATLAPYSVHDASLKHLIECLEHTSIPQLTESLVASGLADLALQLDESNSLTKLPLLREAGLGAAPGQSPGPVSLYIPCFNGAAFLNDVLPAALGQSYPLAEIFVVDDGSTDASAAIARGLGITVVQHPKNLGLAAARNTAIAHAKTPFLACLDADAAPDRYWLERLMPSFDDAKVAGAGGRLVEQHTLSIADRWRARMMAQHYGDKPLSQQAIFGCNGVFRLQVLRSLGGYNQSYTRSYEDIDLSKRLLLAGHDTRYHPDALCRHQRRDTPVSVTDTCFQWRLPHLLSLGFTSSSSAFGGTLGTNLRHDLREIEELASTGDLELSYPSLLMLLRSPLRISKLVAENFSDSERGAITNLAYALLLRALALFDLSPLTKKILAADLRAGISELQTEAQTDAWLSRCGLRNAGDLLSSYFSSDNAFASSLVGVLGALPDVVRFRPEIAKGLEVSAAQCHDGSNAELPQAETLVLNFPSGAGAVTCSTLRSSNNLNVQLGPSAHLSLDIRERLVGAEVSSFVVNSAPGQEMVALWWGLFLASSLPSAHCVVSYEAPGPSPLNSFAAKAQASALLKLVKQCTNLSVNSDCRSSREILG